MNARSSESQPDAAPSSVEMPSPRAYQQEMLDESLRRNIIIALDTGSGKTLIAILRLKHEMEREPTKISWFFAPTVALCEQQRSVIRSYLPVSVGLVSGANEPDQWKDASLWDRVIRTHRIMVSTPQVFLDALRHGYISLGKNISLLVFDEAHHAVDNHPYNRIMAEFYFKLPPRIEANVWTFMRPAILGLTASPIYGGNVIKAFEKIEGNLDSTIRAPRRTRAELEQYVHRPVFKHVMYNIPTETGSLFSTNLASLSAVLRTINIENDPSVGALRARLARSNRGTSEYQRMDQKLSKMIDKQSSFTHKGLRDFERATNDICNDLGPWAADWFVFKVLERARQAANPYNNMIASWKRVEKAYLLTILEKVVVSPTSYYPTDIADDCSDKIRALIECLTMEKAMVESDNEVYSCIIFVERRDAVIALAEVLEHHPTTKNVFRIGTLLGTSDGSHRHSMMDITRVLAKEAQVQTLAEFRAGEKNLIVATAVAEEGIDIQACCSVIRWNLPQNMASWAQSRGRARKKKSTFTLMFEEGGKQQTDVAKWAELERQMVALYNDPRRDLAVLAEEATEEDKMDEDDEDEELVLRVEATGALLTLHSAVAHLAHFCAVIPNSTHADNRPLYDLDPPEFPEGWHLETYVRAKEPYSGPYGSRVTLPRTIPLPERKFSVPRVYKNIISAHRHAAFKAYSCLYEAGLLNDQLLPITSVVEPELEQEVKDMLADVEKRAGFAKISMSNDPWEAEEAEDDSWYWAELTLDGLAPLYLYTRAKLVTADMHGGPVLHRRDCPPIQTNIKNLGKVDANSNVLSKARIYTRRIFWGLNHSRMSWGDLDFSYLFIPKEDVDTEWDSRRSWLSSLSATDPAEHPHPLIVRADLFGKHFGYPQDVTLVHRDLGTGRPFRFVGWRYEPLDPEEEGKVLEKYRRAPSADVEIMLSYPLLVVEAYPPRSNFLLPIPPKKELKETPTHPSSFVHHLMPQKSSIVMLSHEEAEYSFLLPSVLRSLSMTMGADSLRRTLFVNSPLTSISLSLLTIAITAPSSGEKFNYQRLETLGDTVLKLLAGIQLLAEYPLWHEGYLSRRKDHSVSNVRLAKEDVKNGIYRWIIRDAMLGRKWKPRYFSKTETVMPNNAPSPVIEEENVADSSTNTKISKKGMQLSTKVLADVVESIIGAAYLHGGFALGYEAVKFFDLGIKWQPNPNRIAQLLSRVEILSVEETRLLPPQLADVERMLGYTFRRKLLLIEALTHASYQHDSRTPSYERMEFLGDSVLDMVVTDYLYRAPGKNYSPGHMHLRKSAVVNGHILSYICLKTCIKVDADIPRPNAEGAIVMSNDLQDIHLWKCLLHSSPRILEDQLNASTRYTRCKAEIEEGLWTGTVFPWAALTRLQAPKFFSDMVESIIGAVFLDSEGSIDIVRSVLRKLGIMDLLKHIVDNDVDVLHPVSRLGLWAQKNNRQIEYEITRSGGKVTCAVLVDEQEETRVTNEYRGKPSQEEVKYAAAEAAIKAFKLRDVGVALKKKKAPKKKGKKMDTKKN